MRTEYRLWHWLSPSACGEKRDLYQTAEQARHAAGIPPGSWSPGASGSIGDGGWWSRRREWGVTPELVPETNEDRIEIAAALALEYGQTDGDHHKMWVIDQMLRVLAGDQYEQLITEYCDGEDGPETYTWDEGIAP